MATYLPLPNGQWEPYTRENAKLCVNSGWHEIVEAAFDVCDVVALLLPSPVTITALAQSKGRILIYTSHPSYPWTLRNAVILLGVRGALEELWLESGTTCEVCGCQLEYLDPALDTLGLCEEHAGSTWIPGGETKGDEEDGEAGADAEPQ